MAAGQPRIEERLRALMELVIEEARSNPDFQRRLEQALAGRVVPTGAGNRRRGSHRRNPPSLDPFALYEQGEERLRDTLSDLDIELLKDIVAGYGMDRARLALRWRTPGRLIDLIVDTVKSRTQKGDAFRG